VKARLDSLFNFFTFLKLVRKDHFRFYKIKTLSFPNLRIWLNNNLSPKTASTTTTIIKYKNMNKLPLNTLNRRMEIISKFNKNNIILKLKTKLLKIKTPNTKTKYPEENTKEKLLRICNSKYYVLNSFRFFLKPPRFIFFKL
jgi:hypothetical protein